MHSLTWLAIRDASDGRRWMLTCFDARSVALVDGRLSTFRCSSVLHSPPLTHISLSMVLVAAMSTTSTSAEPLNADNLARLSRRSSTDHLDWVIEQCRTTYSIEKLPAATEDRPWPSSKRPSVNQEDATRPSPWRRRDGGDKGS
ncbi:hypothetical protein BDZ90DRAFT_231195, partial [Jaminaea rosea]